LFPHLLPHTLRERDAKPFSRRARVRMRERLDVMGLNFKLNHYRDVFARSSLYNARQHVEAIPRPSSNPVPSARVVKLVDTTDLKSVGLKRLYRFNSGPGHQKTKYLLAYKALTAVRRCQ
jgi:hypothetical protein